MLVKWSLDNPVPVVIGCHRRGQRRHWTVELYARTATAVEEHTYTTVEKVSTAELSDHIHTHLRQFSGECGEILEARFSALSRVEL